MNEPETGTAPGRPACVVCGASGRLLYEDLEDRLVGTPGRWRMLRCADAGCGLLWLDPPPDARTLAAAYQGYHTHAPPPGRTAWERTLRRWLREGHFAARFGYPVRGAWLKRVLALALRPDPDLRENLDRIVMHLEPRPGGRVLDVGCGGGLTLAQLRDLGWQVEGVDPDPEVAAAAARRGLTVRVGSLPQQGYPDASFDAVTLGHVIEHVAEPAALLAECRRVLRPDGRLSLVTPNAASLGHARFGRDWRGLEPPRHLQVFTAAALERAVRAARLRPLTLRTSAGGAAFIHAETRRLLGAAGAAPRDAEARRFAREERARIAAEPGLGEELVLIAVPE